MPRWIAGQTQASRHKAAPTIFKLTHYLPFEVLDRVFEFRYGGACFKCARGSGAFGSPDCFFRLGRIRELETELEITKKASALFAESEVRPKGSTG